jgi:uncharacterized membrane protein YiaA
MIMTEINLLPWREEHRQEQKKGFVVMVVMVCVFAAAKTQVITADNTNCFFNSWRFSSRHGSRLIWVMIMRILLLE